MDHKAVEWERTMTLGLVVDELVDAVIVIKPNQEIVVANLATSRLFGYSPAELLGMNLTTLMPERFRHAHERGVDAYVAHSGGVRNTLGYIDVVGLTKDGNEIPLSLSMTFYSDQEKTYVIGVLRDMSELAQAHETIHRQLLELQSVNRQLQTLADVDHLTGVLNRRAMHQILHKEWGRELLTEAPMALLLCDIDFFKHYNDTYGHLEGDKCLFSVASALTKAVHGHGVVARFGGEEFVVMVPSECDVLPIEMAKRMQQSVWDLDIAHSGSTVAPIVTLSIGVAVRSNDHNSVDALLKSADDALYVAKRKRDRFVVWDPMVL